MILRIICRTIFCCVPGRGHFYLFGHARQEYCGTAPGDLLDWDMVGWYRELRPTFI